MLPTAVRSLGMFYNKKLLRESNLGDRPAGSLDDYVRYALAAAKRDRGGNLTQAGATIGIPSQDYHWWREVLVRQHGGKPYSDDFRKVTYANEAGAAAIAWYTDLQRKHRVAQAGFLSESQAAFRAGRAAQHIDADPAHCFMPDGLAEDLDVEAAAYELRIAAAGGIDLQILGLGRNGHIAYNEPASSHDSRTRAVSLAPETVALAAPAFAPGPAPRRGLTMGVGTILEARRIILLASGADKAQAVANALAPPSRTACPASALQRHRDALFCLDAAATAQLPERE